MNTKKQQLREFLEIIANYRPIDDDFMRELFRNNLELVQEVVRIITGIKNLIIIKAETQYDLKRLAGSRSVCLDILAENDKGWRFDIEIQREDKNMPVQRPRYHISAMDVDFLRAGAKFGSLPMTYSIIICEKDPFGYGKLIYVFDRRERDLNFPLNDGTIIIYLNCAYNNPKDVSDLANLARDFTLSNPDGMSNKILAECARFFKEQQKGEIYMCRTMEELKRKAAAEAAAEATAKANKMRSIEIASKILKSGNITEEQVAYWTDLNAEEIRKLIAATNANNNILDVF